METKSIQNIQDKITVDQDGNPVIITDQDGNKHNLQKLLDDYANYKTEDLKLRNIAEISNIKKRKAIELRDRTDKVKFDSLESLIELDDDFYKASKMLNDEQLAIIKPFNDKLKGILTKNGISDIEPSEYDSDQQEVISVVQSNQNKIDVISKGYKIGEHILRHPKVVLFKNA